MNILKRAFAMNISEEALFMFDPTMPNRKVDRLEEIPLTEEDIAAHARAKLALEEIETSPWIEGGFEDGLSLKELVPRAVIHYAETHEEWLERCRAIRAEGTVGA